MMHDRYVRACMIAALGLSMPAAYATNGDQMLGVTATQWGMAGAVAAAPQDAGAVLTNPAGLAVVEMDDARIDMGFGFMNPPREVNGVESDSNLYMFPSGAMAFRNSDKVTVGMGMSGLSGMGVDFDDSMEEVPGNQNVVTNKQFFKIAPGFAYRVNDKASVGAALNIDYQSLAMDIGAMNLHLPQNQVYGFGASVGFIYQINEQFQFGFSYISEQAMDEFVWNTTNGTYRMTMDAPAQTSIGLAFRPDSSWLIEADVKHIAFSEVLDTVALETPMGDSEIEFGWDDQTVFSIAAQKQLTPKTQVRFGYNYGESPIDEEDVNNNIGSLAITETHYSLGLTQQVGKRVSTSFSYVRAMHNEITSSVAPYNTIELEQNIVNFQISYRN
ncbi:MAG: outer membrane protein transport protein [Pseudomonadota bacterium]